MLLCDDNLDVLETLPPDRTKYTYDGLNRRITQTQPAEDPRDFYYSANWQIVEERLGSTTDAQYVWSPVYVDAMVFRDKDTNVGNIRSFAMQDANFNMTRVLTLIEATSTWIAERYVNDPYGKFVTYNDAWTLAAGQVAFQHHHQGLMYNDLTGLYWNRNRDYSPSQQRFIQQDPLGYVDGLFLYSYQRLSPVYFSDPWGLEATSEERKKDAVEKAQDEAEILKDAAKEALENIPKPTPSSGYDDGKDLRGKEKSMSNKDVKDYTNDQKYKGQPPESLTSDLKDKAMDKASGALFDQIMGYVNGLTLCATLGLTKVPRKTTLHEAFNHFNHLALFDQLLDACVAAYKARGPDKKTPCA